MKFRIRLKWLHDQQALSYYRVARESGIAPNTVKKYVEAEYVDVDYLPTTLALLCRYYGVNWRDPAIIEEVDSDEA